MSFAYEEKPSASPFVDTLWRTEDQADGTYMAPADGRWDLVFITEAASGQTKILLSGPSSGPTPVPYRKGNRNFGIRFSQGVYMLKAPKSNMTDTTLSLPMSRPDTFELGGRSWQLPTYETADSFLEDLAEASLLRHDGAVQAVLEGRRKYMSDRSIQRHFLGATGLTPKYMNRIDQAQRAIRMLQQGRSIKEVAAVAGYADQAHLTRTLKQMTGYTPAQIQGITELLQ